MAWLGGRGAQMPRSTTKVVSDAQGAPWKPRWTCESSRLRSMDTAVPRLSLTAAATDTTYGEPCVVCTQTTAATSAHVLLSELVGLWSQVDHG